MTDAASAGRGESSKESSVRSITQFLLTLINSFEASAMLTYKQRLTDLALE